MSQCEVHAFDELLWDMHLLLPTRSWEPIEKYINEQYEKFLKEEVNIARKKRIPDTRVHCCLYFISPTGHSYVPAPPPRGAWLWLAPSVPVLYR